MSQVTILIGLLAEGAALGQAGETSSGLAKDDIAVAALHNHLRVREDGGDEEATGALDIHEEGVGRLHQALELVLLLLVLGEGVEKIQRGHGEIVEKCFCCYLP